MYAERSTPTIPFSAFVCLYISEIDMALQPCQKEFLHIIIHLRLKLNNLYIIYIRPLPSWPPFFSSAFSLFVRSFSFILLLFLFMFIIFFFFYSLYLSPLHFTIFLFSLLFPVSWNFAFALFRRLTRPPVVPFFFHLRYTLYIVSTRPCPLFFCRLISFVFYILIFLFFFFAWLFSFICSVLFPYFFHVCSCLKLKRRKNPGSLYVRYRIRALYLTEYIYFPFQLAPSSYAIIFFHLIFASFL